MVFVFITMVGSFSFTLELNMDTIFLDALVSDLMASWGWNGRNHTRLCASTLPNKAQEIQDTCQVDYIHEKTQSQTKQLNVPIKLKRYLISLTQNEERKTMNTYVYKSTYALGPTIKRSAMKLKQMSGGVTWSPPFDTKLPKIPYLELFLNLGDKSWLPSL